MALRKLRNTAFSIKPDASHKHKSRRAVSASDLYDVESDSCVPYSSIDFSRSTDLKSGEETANNPASGLADTVSPRTLFRRQNKEGGFSVSSSHLHHVSEEAVKDAFKNLQKHFQKKGLFRSKTIVAKTDLEAWISKNTSWTNPKTIATVIHQMEHNGYLVPTQAPKSNPSRNFFSLQRKSSSSTLKRRVTTPEKPLWVGDKSVEFLDTPESVSRRREILRLPLADLSCSQFDPVSHILHVEDPLERSLGTPEGLRHSTDSSSLPRSMRTRSITGGSIGDQLSTIMRPKGVVVGRSLTSSVDSTHARATPATPPPLLHSLPSKPALASSNESDQDAWSLDEDGYGLADSLPMSAARTDPRHCKPAARDRSEDGYGVCSNNSSGSDSEDTDEGGMPRSGSTGLQAPPAVPKKHSPDCTFTRAQHVPERTPSKSDLALSGRECIPRLDLEDHQPVPLSEPPCPRGLSWSEPTVHLPLSTMPKACSVKLSSKDKLGVDSIDVLTYLTEGGDTSLVVPLLQRNLELDSNMPEYFDCHPSFSLPTSRSSYHSLDMRERVSSDRSSERSDRSGQWLSLIQHKDKGETSPGADKKDHLERLDEEIDTEEILHMLQGDSGYTHDLDPLYFGGDTQLSWNERFQRIMNSEWNSSWNYRLRHATELFHLSCDFISSAKAFGRIIISERYLPLHKKTIKPVDIGGIAGGEKYIVHDILFKFAVDFNGMYGSDYAAAKAADNELKGLISYLNARRQKICVPMMALVDYFGFRLIAMSVLPINADTLVYGTNDGGRTMHDHEDFAFEMKEIAHELNIQPHVCGLNSCASPKLLYSAADIEGHIGTDGRLYLVDFGRSFPPVKPDSAIQSGHLYLLFRPEFVRKSKTPLCPDGFSAFQATDPNYRKYNADIDNATRILFEETIPNFAKSIPWLLLDFYEKKQVPSITDKLHRLGINMRYIGRVLQCIREDHEACHCFMLGEACARAIKYFLRLFMRKQLSALKLPIEGAFVRITCQYLNLVFSQTEQSSHHWATDIKTRLRKRFSIGSPYTDDSYDLKKGLMDMCKQLKYPLDFRLIVLRRLMVMTGVQLSLYASQRFHNLDCYSTFPEETPPFEMTDIVSVGEKIKHMGIVSDAAGTFFYYKGMQSRINGDYAVALKMFQQAIENYNQALLTSPNNKMILRNIAKCNFKAVETTPTGMLEQLNPTDPEVQNTDQYFQRMVQADAKDPISLHLYASFLARCGREARAQDFYLRSLENDPNSVVVLMDYVSLLEKVKLTQWIQPFVERILKLTESTKTETEALAV